MRNARSGTNKRHEIQTTYSLHGQTLEVVDSGKYLGVTISDDLSWQKHVDTVAAKASRTQGFLRRNLGECVRAVGSAVCASLVRPTLECASLAWGPAGAGDANKLWEVRRQVAGFVHGGFSGVGGASWVCRPDSWQSWLGDAWRWWGRQIDDTVQDPAWLSRNGHW